MPNQESRKLHIERVGNNEFFMFNLFGKKKKDAQTSVPELNDFQKSFNKEQKSAVLNCIALVGTREGTANEAELSFLTSSYKLLGLAMGDLSISQMQTKSENYLINTLKTLDKGQQDWFIVTLQSMVLSNKKDINKKLKVAIDICNRMGISDDRYVEVVNKAEAIIKRVTQ